MSVVLTARQIKIWVASGSARKRYSDHDAQLAASRDGPGPTYSAGTRTAALALFHRPTQAMTVTEFLRQLNFRPHGAVANSRDAFSPSGTVLMQLWQAP
jgi:hypothetical protein